MDIKLVKIKKKFNDVTVLNDLDMTIKEGSVSCIMGASGSGKTTLANILVGLVKQDEGEVHGLKEARIAAVFQEDRLIEHWDAVKNVLLVCGRDITESVVKEHFRRVGLEAIRSKPVRNLSGGMRRRVAIVRALLAESNIIILDEPFKGLDEALKQQVIAYIAEQTAGKTVIIITHDRDDAKLFGADIHLLQKQN